MLHYRRLLVLLLAVQQKIVMHLVLYTQMLCQISQRRICEIIVLNRHQILLQFGLHLLLIREYPLLILRRCLAFTHYFDGAAPLLKFTSMQFGLFHLRLHE